MIKSNKKNKDDISYEDSVSKELQKILLSFAKQ